MPGLSDFTRRFDAEHPAAPGAVTINGETESGHACCLTDNTGGIDTGTLKELLQLLIREGQFGGAGLSAAGAGAIVIGAPRCGHIQVDGVLYRLLVFPYEARIERF